MKPWRAKVLLIGVPGQLAKNLCISVENMSGCEVFTTATAARTGQWDLVFADIGRDASAAKRTIDQFKSADDSTRIILFSQNTKLDFVVPLIRSGVWNILPSPLSVRLIADEIYAWQIEAEKSRAALEAANEILPVGKMVGNSNVMQQLQRDIKKAAATNARVLITGENGVGKELVAQAIHQWSRRADMPFVKVNCAAIPRGLIESELFGYEEGAFTGAVKQKKGLIAHAHTGTLFLDEIGDMAIETQVKLLRVLQENQFLPVGGRQPVAFDTRIIAATNKNLRAEITSGHFRKDLYFRLNVIPLHVPPLRERQQDILLLFEYFQQTNHFERKKLSSDAIDLLWNYNWPGNVRELYNLVERISAMVAGPEIDAAILRDIQPDIQYRSTGGTVERPAQQRKTRTLR